MKKLNNFRTLQNGDYIIIKNVNFQNDTEALCIVSNNLGDDNSCRVNRIDTDNALFRLERTIYYNENPTKEFYILTLNEDPEYFL